MPYVATIDILIDVETETEAADAVASAIHRLMRTLRQSILFRDWMWSREEELQRAPIPADFAMDNQWPEIINPP